ncbi:uncharacterized protein [Lepeophtheirus salmonis]|uniref:uncharacterized protein isoform X2 n=1 Tax=Lepeophtheirus salmonis TaxID=72036 RepID=UPI001AEA2196|nr:uncharacterized protein LOC121126758 isoform X2 [Lepeophtheirus salmonis]
MCLLKLIAVAIVLLGLSEDCEAKSIFVLQDLLENIETEKDNINIGSKNNKTTESFNENVNGNNIVLEKEELHLGETNKAPSYVPLPFDCRTYIAENILTHEECAFYSTNSFYQRGKPLIAQCRWDPRYRMNGVCLCPRTESLCYSDELKNKCYWSRNENIPHEASNKNGICISNAEKFYYVLRDLLLKRGKKDFAVRIIYNSDSALGELPFGPHGPSLINSKDFLTREKMGQYRHPGLLSHHYYRSFR